MVLQHLKICLTSNIKWISFLSPFFESSCLYGEDLGEDAPHRPHVTSSSEFSHFFCCHGKISLLKKGCSQPSLLSPLPSLIQSHQQFVSNAVDFVRLRNLKLSWTNGKEEEKRDFLSGFSVIPFIRAERLVMVTSWLALFARRRSQPKVIATSSRGHGPSLTLTSSSFPHFLFKSLFADGIFLTAE